MNNWAQNYQYQAREVHFPKTVGETCQLVRASRKLRAVGTRHSFHGIADSEGGDLVSLRHFDQVVRRDLDATPPTVTVGAGITYGQLCPVLQSLGYALPNLASLAHVSVAGACATATHGSGNTLRSLASAVSALRFVDASGEVRESSRDRDGDTFDGMVVALGGLGLVVELTLQLEKSFDVVQRVYENLGMEELAPHFDAITESVYSVSLFTDWQGQRFNQVWLKSRVGDRAPLDLRDLGATLAGGQRHPVQGSCNEASLGQLIDPKKCTIQGEAGPWHMRLPHFRLDDEPSSSGEELQTEYLLPYETAVPAITTLFELGEQIRPLIQASEVRTVARDALWMSPFYGRDSVAIHFTWRKDQSGVGALLPVIEERLGRFDPRPHWGKLFHMNRLSYPRRGDFRDLLQSHDPDGKFRNKFLGRYVFETP